jgi:hypothetical protein
MSCVVCIVSASGQNVFFEELLTALANALDEHGVSVERAVDHFPRLRDDLVYLFVPHELLPLIRPEAHPSSAQLNRSITLITEQPGTKWFELAADIAARARIAVDINQLGVRELAKRGIAARYLQLGYVPSWDHWGGRPAAERRWDVTFMGAYTTRRATALARCGRHLVGKRTALHLVETAAPHLASSQHFLAGDRKWRILSASRLILNIHRSELGYLEWQRVIGAMLNGCVVVSEHSVGYEPLEPGRHLVSVGFDSLDIAIGALLEDEERVRRIRDEAYSFLREELPLSKSIHVLAEAAQELVDRPIQRSGRTGPPSAPCPAPSPGRETEIQRLLRERTETDIMRMALKDLALCQREIRATLADIASPQAAAAPDSLLHLGPARPSPRVSVVLTVYNYAACVGRAIESVAASDFVDFELVVVDDASTDTSALRIRETIERSPWMSATVVTRHRNRGLPAARNLGVEHARGEYVFILDADNEIYPHALARLVEALDETPDAGFAYGLLEQFGLDGPVNLMSWLGWDPGRLRYGNYVDAMAMIRRPLLNDLGGYTTDGRLYGWEDFALWCALAEIGARGVRIPEIMARYRVGVHSMITITNIDALVAWSTLVDRFACLTN